MTRMVCLGDSFTEGMSDDLRPDGHHLGWADRVAAALGEAASPDYPGPIQYANLAIRGKLLDQVIAEQVPTALDLQPNLITFHAGANNVLRPTADVPGLLQRYAKAVDDLAGSGATIVLFTSLTRAGGKGIVADRVASRLEELNAGIRRVARRFDCILVDNERIPALTDRRFWAIDRLHLNAEGHTRVAAHVLTRLGVTDHGLLQGPVGWWEEPLPPEQRSKREDLVADAAWTREHFLPWLGRRVRRVSSGDGMSAKDPVLRTMPKAPGMKPPGQRTAADRLRTGA